MKRFVLLLGCLLTGCDETPDDYRVRAPGQDPCAWRSDCCAALLGCPEVPDAGMTCSPEPSCPVRYVFDAGVPDSGRVLDSGLFANH